MGERRAGPTAGSFAGTGFEVLTGLDVVARHASRSIALTEWRCHEHRHSVSTGKHQPWNVLGFVHGGSFRIACPRGAGVADPAVMLVFRADEEYSTAHPGSCGDHGSAIALSPALAAELRETIAREGGGDPWSAPLRPANAGVFSRQLRILSRLRARPVSAEIDGLEIDEALLALAGRALAPVDGERAFAARPPKSGERDRIAAIQELLERRFAERLGIEELAREVGLSPFELCRQFRRRTGWTVHGYRTHLRIVHGLERLASEPPGRLLDLALDLGFDGHSHFSEVFRRRVGQTPSAFRAAFVSA